MTKKRRAPPPATKWDFLINLTNKLYNLIRLGYFYALLAVMVVATFPIIAWRTPEGELHGLVADILRFLESCMAGYAGMGLLILYLLYIIRRQKVSFKRNLEQKCKERKKLIHTENPKKLGIHMSSKLIREAGLDEGKDIEEE